jgi:molybdopterin-guanine dinucleotide biosynthesis protein A
MSPSAKNVIVGAIIAGGRSSRMGEDKRLLTFEDETFLERAAKLLHGVCSEVLYAAPDPPPLPIEARHAPDRFPGMGVLSGIHAALCEASTDRVLCIAVDTPLLTAEWLVLMDSRCRESGLPCIPRTGRRLHPLPGCYPASVRPYVEAALREGRSTACRLLEAIGAVSIDEGEADRNGCSPGALTNVNTPEDWRTLLEISRRR